MLADKRSTTGWNVFLSAPIATYRPVWPTRTWRWGRCAQRSGRPRTALGIIDPLIDAVIETDPRQRGYRATVWTASLLRSYLAKNHRLSVSSQSVRLALARLRLRWKRPRHTLALRPETWGQSKGG